MSIRIDDFIDVEAQSRALGCQLPTGLALLPRNFAVALSRDELLHESEMPTVRVLWRRAGIDETPIEPVGQRFPQVSEKSFTEWIGPIIFVSGALLSANPALLAIALGVISNYLTDWFRGVPIAGRIVRLDVVAPTANRKFKKIHYEGSVEGLKELPAIVHEVVSGE